MDREQEQRERAYRIWEAEGRPDGLDEEHWKRAEEQHEATEQSADDAERDHDHASDEFKTIKSIPHRRESEDDQDEPAAATTIKPKKGQ